MEVAGLGGFRQAQAQVDADGLAGVLAGQRAVLEIAVPDPVRASWLPC